MTKSTLVTRDINLLKKIHSMVAMTITTEDETAKILEPCAPPIMKRFKALETLIQKDVSVSARVDPIIPSLNDNPQELVRKLGSIGVSHVTCSTYKVKQDNWKRFTQAFPALAKSLQPLYFERGERIGHSFYLSKEMRREMVLKVKELVEDEGMKFSSCREGFPQLNSAVCDGSWLIRERIC